MVVSRPSCDDPVVFPLGSALLTLCVPPSWRLKKTIPNSPEDQAILEAEYQRNSKPDKAARMSIVNRVALGEKEVQVSVLPVGWTVGVRRGMDGVGGRRLRLGLGHIALFPHGLPRVVRSKFNIGLCSLELTLLFLRQDLVPEPPPELETESETPFVRGDATLQARSGLDR